MVERLRATVVERRGAEMAVRLDPTMTQRWRLYVVARIRGANERACRLGGARAITARALLAIALAAVVLVVGTSSSAAAVLAQDTGLSPAAAVRAQGDTSSPEEVAGGPAVRGVRLAGPITAVTADYIDRALGVAERERAAAFLIELNTPGGDLTSMLRIVQRLLNAEVPTVAWVGPQGAQAASAGTFVVLAAHAAGMAPRTTIGAASPVGPSGEDLGETSGRKLTEDMAATARGLAERRGQRAATWAEAAVREAASASAGEALDLGLIDAVAADAGELLGAVDGLAVEVAGEKRLLATAGAEVRPVPMTTAEELLSRLIHPAVALLLLTVGVNAILIELSNPGGYVAGLIGIMSLALGFYSLGVLDANLIGLVFLAAAFALFLLDIKAPTHGLLTAAGIGLFVVGAVILFSDGYFEVPWGTIAALALATGLFFAFVVSAAIRAMRRQPTTGSEGLMGRTAIVRRALDPGGVVLVHGELWAARVEDEVWATRIEGEAAVPAEARVRVVGHDGHTLVVTPIE